MLGFLVIRHIFSVQMRVRFAFGWSFVEHNGKLLGKKSRVPPYFVEFNSEVTALMYTCTENIAHTVTSDGQ